MPPTTDAEALHVLDQYPCWWLHRVSSSTFTPDLLKNMGLSQQEQDQVKQLRSGAGRFHPLYRCRIGRHGWGSARTIACAVQLAIAKTGGQVQPQPNA